MPQNKQVHKEYMRKRRQGSQSVIPKYDRDLTVREIVTLHSQRTQDQRFPGIPLPFGEAYYTALEGKRVKYA